MSITRWATRGGFGGALVVLEHDGELVTAEARGGVGLAHSRPQALAGLDQELVAGCVTEGVVDELEPVQVHEQHRQSGQSSPRAGQRVLEPVQEQGAVGQAGKGVVERLTNRIQGLGVGQGQAHMVGEVEQGGLLALGVDTPGAIRPNRQASDDLAVLANGRCHRRLQLVGRELVQCLGRAGVVGDAHQGPLDDRPAARAGADRGAPQPFGEFRMQAVGGDQQHVAWVVGVEQAQADHLVAEQLGRPGGDGVQDLLQWRPVGDRPLQLGQLLQ